MRLPILAAPLLALVIAAVALRRPAPPAPPPAEVPAAPAPEAPVAPPALAPVWEVDLDGADRARAPRVASLDLATIDGRAQRVEVRYDLDAVTRPRDAAALRDDPEWQVGVRVLLGEVGAWRLRTNRWAILEGVGVLETVRNRFDPDLANPLRKRGVAEWPGCGRGATFTSCIDPKQYLGLASDRALRPRDACPDADELAAAVDRAALAWFVYEESLLGEITAGATSFVHLCGGAGYGRAACDGPGDDPHRGPALFRGPAAWLPSKGRYALESLAKVDFEAGPLPSAPRAYPDYLVGSDASVYAGALEP